MQRKPTDTGKVGTLSTFYLHLPAPKNCPFKLLIEKWLTYSRADGLSEKTLLGYSEVAAKFWWWWNVQTGYSTNLGQHPKCVTTKEAREFASYLREPGLTSRWGYPTAKDLAAASIASYGRTVKAFFGWLEREGHIAQSPFNKAVKFTTRKQTKVIKSVSHDSLTLIFANLTEPNRLITFAGRRDLAIVSLFLDSGVRTGELLSMRLCDVDLPNRVFSVKGKTGRRKAHFSDTAKGPLADYLRVRATQVKEENESPDNALWLSTDGNSLTACGLKSMITRLQKRAGVKLHAHQLRHSFALDMSKKVSMFELRDLLGHASISTTQIYVQNNPETLSGTYQRTVSPLAELEPSIPGLKRRGRPRKYQ